MNFNKKIIPLVLTATMSQNYIYTMALADTSLDPQAGAYGYYIDNWNKNTTSNMTPESNPAIGVLSGFLKIFTPGSSWNSGTILNEAVHEHNINTVIDMTKDNTTSAAVGVSNTTAAAAKIDITKFTTGSAAQVYFDDRRDQNYSITDGLGKYTDLFRSLANAGTTITRIPDDAITEVYTDGGNSNGKWADENSKLGDVVKFIDTLRNSAASTTPAKNYYQYMRPFRWSKDVNVLPTLIPVEKPESQASSDGGFPSGHTNAAYVSALALAYAVPERFQEILTRASELGNDRIKSGYHSPLDVIGGRTMATAIAASALYNSDNYSLKTEAYNQTHSLLITQEGTSTDRFSDYQENKHNYTDRLTYGFDKIGASNKPMVVPKGAEVLLETRLPYLDANQRREVLYTTGIESGYPVLDDTEGWGRLNLFAAADGYGSFNDTVTVNMDASKGGFNSSDSWRNDISGTGSLVKEGTGTLKLEGNNIYSGGTQINEGTLEADSSTAFGSGNVTNNGGRILENVSGEVEVKNDYKQSENSTLELSIGSKSDIFEIDGNATFSGKLKLDFTNNYIPNSDMTIISIKGNIQNTKFTSIEATGLPSNYTVNLNYYNNEVKLSLETTESSSGSHHHSSITSNSTSLTNNNAGLSVGINTTNEDNKTGKETETGWQQKDGVWYNLSKSGVPNTGWLKSSDDNWYYLSHSGIMKTGWFKDNDGKWYYLDESGVMEHDKYIDGYYLGSDGAWK